MDIEYFIQGYEQMNLILLPMSRSFFDQYKTSMSKFYDNDTSNIGSQVKHSRTVGFYSEGNIMCWKKTGQWPGFKFLLSFEPLVWYSLIAALLLLTVIKTITGMKGLSQLGANFWSFFSLSFGVTNSQNKHTIYSTFLTILWLFSITVILSAFSGVLLRFFMEPIPVIVIDSWEDLFQTKELKITGFHLSFIQIYIDQFQDQEEIAKDFGQRFYAFQDVDNQDIIDKYSENDRFVINCHD